MSSGRQDHTASVLGNGKVLVAGGWNGVVLNSVELYDPTSGTWTNTGNMSITRFGYTASVLLHGKVLVTGGFYSLGI